MINLKNLKQQRSNQRPINMQPLQSPHLLRNNYPTGNHITNTEAKISNPRPNTCPWKNTFVMNNIMKNGVESRNNPLMPDQNHAQPNKNVFESQQKEVELRNTMLTSDNNQVLQRNTTFEHSFNSLPPQMGFHESFDNKHVQFHNVPFSTANHFQFPSLPADQSLSSRPRDNAGQQFSNKMPTENLHVFEKNSVDEENYKERIFGQFYNMMFTNKVTGPEKSNFKLTHEDFPVLPGTQQTATTNNDLSSILKGSDLNYQCSPPPSIDNTLNQKVEKPSKESTINEWFRSLSIPVNPKKYKNPKNPKTKTGVQTSANGNIRNIPGSMLPDQFGVIGQLLALKVVECNPELSTLNVGQDLTKLGLNLNTPENIHDNFAGPFANSMLQPQFNEYNVIPDYRINYKIRDKLPPINLSKASDDLLFYIFYSFPLNPAQLSAAYFLRQLGWDYHKTRQMWILVRGSVAENLKKDEPNSYCVFNKDEWKKEIMELSFDYSDLENENDRNLLF